MTHQPRRDRDFLIYYARVLLREARSRRGTSFAHCLLNSAGVARREALAAPAAAQQLNLFGVVA